MRDDKTNPEHALGASKRQITLHTGVYYTASKYQTFSAVSDSLDHNPSAVWAFMKPVLDKIFYENPHIEIVLLQ